MTLYCITGASLSTACGTWEGCAPATELYTGIPHQHMTLVVVVDAVLAEVVVMYAHATDVCSHRKVIVCPSVYTCVV